MSDVYSVSRDGDEDTTHHVTTLSSGSEAGPASILLQRPDILSLTQNPGR